MIVKPPNETFFFDGNRVPPEGIDVDEVTAKSLIERGWVAAQEEIEGEE